MFKGLKEQINLLNADAKNVANCEKAKKLRTKLLAIGLPLAIVGVLGTLACAALFIMSADEGYEFLIPMLSMIPCIIIFIIGYSLSELGFKIVITGYTTNLIDETVGNNCPNCNATINPEMLFCSKCGTKVRKECPNCKFANNHKNEYCQKCGTKLD